MPGGCAAMSKSLGKVAQLARLEERHAAESARSQRGALGDAQGRLEQLQTFRQEYEQRLAALAGDGMDARLLSDYRSFLLRLNEAIGLQSQQVQQRRDQLSARQSELREKSARRESVDTVLERHRLLQARGDGRREQRLQDEASSRRHEDDPGA
jgi:flagellar FliJ protein